MAPMTATSGGDSLPSEPAESHWSLLGTVIDVKVGAAKQVDAQRAQHAVVDEIGRLEQVFSVFDEHSMLRRWMSDGSVPTSNEFDELLSTALGWQRCSRGAFNVSSRRLWKLWADAAADGSRPSLGELHVLAADIVAPPYGFAGFVLEQVGDCRGLDFTAIATGYIIDRAISTAWSLGDLDSLTVSAGGVIAHRGRGPISVDIDDPNEVLDDADPLLVVEICNSAIATSGSARPGGVTDGGWVSQVLDPRTGQPVYSSASVTVVAPDATTADVIATIITVMSIDEGLAFVDAINSRSRLRHPSESFDDSMFGPIECWILDRRGTMHHTGPMEDRA
jgi:thiamine biosynthesis lipoprotein